MLVSNETALPDELNILESSKFAVSFMIDRFNNLNESAVHVVPHQRLKFGSGGLEQIFGAYGSLDSPKWQGFDA